MLVASVALTLLFLAPADTASSSSSQTAAASGSSAVSPPPPTSAPSSPPRWNPRTRMSCYWTTATVAATLAFPTALPLLVGGVAKGLITHTLVLDLLTKWERARGMQRPEWVTPQTLELMMLALAAGGALVNVVGNMPHFTLLLTVMVNQVVEKTDGLGTGVCRSHVPPRPVQRGSLLLVPALVSLGLISLPFSLAPAALGLVLVLTSMGILPAMPSIPAFGFVDRLFAIKRAGLLTTAVYPAWWMSANFIALGVVHGALWLWARNHQPVGAAE
ncbi:MAG: hypothetical protein AB2A00_22440 [Myxococcota bacterium]